MGPIFDQSYNGIIVLSFWPFNYEQLRERDSTNDCPSQDKLDVVCRRSILI